VTIENKHVLVTGADGFIGSHLVEKLLAQGCKVRALAYYNSFNHWGWLEDMTAADGLEVISGDVRDPAFCSGLLKGVDVVFHLAALIAIPYSYAAPQSYVDTNVTGTLNICNAALNEGVARVVIASTSEVYGTAQYAPIDEKHPKQPQSPYSASKIAADSIAESFYRSFDLPLVIARPFNTYGPRQSARAVIPTIVSQLAAGMKEIQLGDMRPTRDFNFVTDTCRGFVELANCSEAAGREVNIGSGREISIGDLFALIQEIMGTDAEAISDRQRIRPEKSEVFRLCCDNGLINSLTGYSPRVDLRHGLEQTIDWFLNPKNKAKYKADIYNV
jgi:NAD dependent epimerase/dehydratase